MSLAMQDPEDPDEQHAVPLAPRGELFSDPGASVVWAAIAALPEGDKHQLYERLTTHVAVSGDGRTPQQEKIARAVAALRDAEELLASESADGELRPALTDQAFRRLHKEHGKRLGWPPESTIRSWLGGTWNDALRAAALAPVPDGEVLVREIGGALTRDEVIAAVRACAEETGDPMPTMGRYLGWARRRDVRQRPGRRPTSQGPIDRLFGGWPRLLIAAELAQPDPTGVVPTGTGGGVKLFRRAAHPYTDEQRFAAIREVASRLGRSPTTTEYDHERMKIFEEETAAGKPARSFPGISSLMQSYPSWDDALEAAGLARRNGRHIKHGTGKRKNGERRRYTDQEHAISLRLGFLAIGTPFTQPAYSQWRKQQTKIDAQERRYRRLASFYAIYGRFGRWDIACREILDGWDPKTDPVDPGPDWTSAVVDPRDLRTDERDA